ncbi:hypothetical protein [Halpernia sp. GG3]
MKKIVISASTLLFCFFTGNLLWAQNSQKNNSSAKDSISKEEKLSIYAGVAYAYKLHYFGRTDDLQSNAVIPTAILKLGKHITFNPSLVFISNKASSLTYAATILNASYNYGRLEGFSGTISFDKYFYKDQTLLVKGAQWGQIGTSFANNNKIIGTVVTANLALVKNNFDVYTSAGLNKQIKIINGQDVYLIQPSVTANFGTQNFTRAINKNNIITPIIPGSQQVVTEDYKKINLLSYDFSLSLTYAYKNFIFNISPGYVIPKNVLTDNGNGTRPELAKNTFYGNAVVVYRFLKK